MSGEKVIGWIIMTIAFGLGLGLGLAMQPKQVAAPIVPEKKDIVDLVVTENDQAKWKYKSTAYALTGDKQITNFHADGNTTDTVKAEIVELPVDTK